MPKLVGIVTGGSTLLGAVTWARDELVKHNPTDSSWHVVDFLPHWTFWQWGFGAVIIILLSVLETSFQRKKEADVVHGGQVGKLNNEIGRLGRQIGELEERLKEGPTVLLSNVAAASISVLRASGKTRSTFVWSRCRPGTISSTLMWCAF